MRGSNERFKLRGSNALAVVLRLGQFQCLGSLCCINEYVVIKTDSHGNI